MGAAQPSATEARQVERRGLDALLCSSVILISLLGYLRTLRPTFGWGDSSELITATYYLGVGHSPGYPTWMLIMHPFSHLPIGDIAFRVNFATALLGAVAVGLLYFVCKQVSRSRPAAFIAALTFAFAATFWDQTTEAEVYTLHMCFVATSTLILLAWRRTRADRWLYLLAGTIGLSLGNHALTMLMIPALLYLVWADRGRHAFTARNIAICAGLFLLGTSVYLYLPIRAMSNPPPHLNNPHTLQEMWMQLTAPGARESMFDRGLWVALERARFNIGRLENEFTVLGCVLALFGVGLLWRRDRRLAIFLVLIGLVDVAYSVNFSIFDIYVYYLPLHFAWAVFISVGVAGTVALAAKAMHRLPPTVVAPTPGWRFGPAIALLLVLPFLQFTRNLGRVDGSGDYGSERFARAVTSMVEPNALILADWWTIAPIGYLKYIEGVRTDLVMFAAPSIHADDGFLDFAQEDFLRSYPSVYFVEMLTYRIHLLREMTYLVPQGPVYRVFLDRPPKEDVIVDLPAAPLARFGDQIGLVQCDLASGKLRPGETFPLTVYWTPLESYNGHDHEAIFVLENEENGRIWQESNLLGHNLYPLDEWRPGEMLREDHKIYLPEPAAPGEYDLYVRVREHGQSKCLSNDKALIGHNERDYLIATITVGDPEPITDRGRIPTLVALLRP